MMTRSGCLILIVLTISAWIVFLTIAVKVWGLMAQYLT